MPKIKKYDKSKLDQAIKDIQNVSKSYRSAEKKYGIPKSTLEFKIKHPGHKETFGPSPILTFDEENFLERWLKDNAAKGFPRKANDLKNSVQKFLSANPRPHNFKNNRPGNGWVKGFLKRHPTITKRTSEGVTAASACLSEQDIRNWFSTISDYIKEKNLEDAFQDPSRIFNGDESGFQAITSERYQEMFKKKQDAKEEQEKQKQERKRRREELEKQKEEKKLQRKEQQNQKMSKKGKKLKLINECTACHGDIKSDEIHCDDCKKFYHVGCIPQHYKHNLPTEDDLFICHNCDEDELDQLYEQYKTAQKDLVSVC